MLCNPSTNISAETHQAHQVVACITQVQSAWRLLAEAVEQAKARNAVLRLIVCHALIRSNSEEDFTQFFRKFRHAASQSCKENDIKLIVEVLDCGDREPTEVERQMREIKTDLLIMSDSLPESGLARWLPKKTARLTRTSLCSVLLLR